MTHEKLCRDLLAMISNSLTTNTRYVQQAASTTPSGKMTTITKHHAGERSIAVQTSSDMPDYNSAR